MKYVYDFGKAYIKNFYGIKQINIGEESKLQRRGRVGRVSPGVYIKLYDSLSTYNFLYHIFLYPIIIYDKVYKFSNIYGFDSKIIENYKNEIKYFDQVYLGKKKKELLNLYNNNLCTNLESLLVYMSSYKISQLYKLLENLKKMEIDKNKYDLNSLEKIGRILKLKMVKNGNIFFFKEPFYINHFLLRPKIIGNGREYYFINPVFIIKI